MSRISDILFLFASTLNQLLQSSVARFTPQVLARYAFTICIVAATLLVSSLLRTNGFKFPPLIAFIVAVAVTTRYLGKGAGLVSFGLSVAVADFFFIPPIYSFLPNLETLPVLLIFLVAAFFVSTFTAPSRRTFEPQLQRSSTTSEAAARQRNRSSGSLGEAAQPDTSTWATGDLEARLANAEARRGDAQRLNESYAASISDLEARFINSEARRGDAQRLNESYAASISDLEARFINSEARRGDAQRLNERYAASISDLEARLVNAEAHLADAQRLNLKYYDSMVDLEARLANASAIGIQLPVIDSYQQPLIRRLPLPQRQIAFMHVPRTGGTGISAYLREKLQPCRVMNSIEFLIQAEPEYVRSLDLIHGHFSFAHVKRFRDDCFLFSILREPVDRLLSFYYNLRSGRETGMEDYPELVQACRTLAIQDFMSINDPKIQFWTRNPVARQFTEYALEDCVSCEELARAAIENAAKFEYIGVLEDLSTSFDILHYLLNWDIAELLPQANVNDDRPAFTDASPEVIQHIREVNSADVSLYEYALRRHRELAATLHNLILQRRELLVDR